MLNDVIVAVESYTVRTNPYAGWSRTYEVGCKRQTLLNVLIT